MDKEEFFGFNLEEEEKVFDILFADDENEAKVSTGCHSNSSSDGASKPEERRVELVTHKAGFDKVDQTRVNEILKKLEENSTFGRLKAKKNAELQENIQEQRWIFERLQAQDLTFARSRVQLCISRIEQKRDLSKYIVCVDMDAYYASIEERDNPALVNRPMGVGDSAMLCTANYTARKFGVRSGMPGYFARKLCPQIVIVKPNFEKYTTVSRKIRTIFARYDPNFYAMSLDEAFLDITNFVQNQNRSSEDVVQRIRDEIYSETKLTASAGIAANKLLAKVCAEVNKPNGQFKLANDKNKILEFLRDLPVRKICGIGQVSARILNGVFDIHTCGELLDKLVYINLMTSENSFNFYMRAALGIGSNGIRNDYTRKSTSTSRTFAPTNDLKSLYEYLYHLAEELAQRLEQENLEGKTISVIFKLRTFEQFTRQKILARYISSQNDLYSYSKAILDKEAPISLRLLGIRITNLRDTNVTKHVSVNRYFATKENDKESNISFVGKEVNDISRLNPTSILPTQENYENPQPSLNGEEYSNVESSSLEQNSQENDYLTSEYHETNHNAIGKSESLYRTPQQQSVVVECRDAGIRKSEVTQHKDDNVDDNVFESPNTSLSLNDNILSAEMCSRINNRQFQNRTLMSSIPGDDLNVALITELSKSSISNEFKNVLSQHENADIIESKVDSKTRKRALENSDKLSAVSELMTSKKRLINDQTQLQVQVNNNNHVKDASADQCLWNCPICDRHFDNPTKMRINSHLEACGAPRFPNTKIGEVGGHSRGRKRGRIRNGSQSSSQPVLTLYDFFSSSHLKI